MLLLLANAPAAAAAYVLNVTTYNPEATLQRVLANYGSASVRPNLASGNLSVDVVEVNFGIDMLFGIDEKEEEWGAKFFSRTWWKDERLAFDEAEGGPLMSLNAEAREKVWTPDLYWDKIVDEKPIPTDVSFQVSPDGSVWRSEHRTVRIRCAMDLTNMPFDTQKCAMWYGLYAYTAAEVVVKWRPGRDALMGWKTSCAGVWTPTALLQEDRLLTYPAGSWSYAYFQLRRHLSPRPTHARAHSSVVSLLPSLLTPVLFALHSLTRTNTKSLMTSYFTVAIALVAIAYLGTWINPGSTPARVALGIICILAVVTNYLALVKSLPPSYEKVWLLDFMLGSFWFNVGLFLEQVAVNFGMQAKVWVVTNADKEFTRYRKAPTKGDHRDRGVDPESPGGCELREGLDGGLAESSQAEDDDDFPSNHSRAPKVKAAFKEEEDDDPDDHDPQLHHKSPQASPKASPKIAATKPPSDLFTAEGPAGGERSSQGQHTLKGAGNVDKLGLAALARRHSHGHSIAAHARHSAAELGHGIHVAADHLTEHAREQLHREVNKSKEVVVKVRSDVRSVIDKDGDGSISWGEAFHASYRLRRHFKFPILRCCGKVRYLDHWARVVFPLVYIPYLFIKMAMVDFGKDHFAKLAAVGDHCGNE